MALAKKLNNWRALSVDNLPSTGRPEPMSPSASHDEKKVVVRIAICGIDARTRSRERETEDIAKEAWQPVHQDIVSKVVRHVGETTADGRRSDHLEDLASACELLVGGLLAADRRSLRCQTGCSSGEL